MVIYGDLHSMIINHLDLIIHANMFHRERNIMAKAHVLDRSKRQ